MTLSSNISLYHNCTSRECLTNPSCIRLYLIASGCHWSNSQPLNESVTPTSCLMSNCEFSFFFSRTHGWEELLPGLGGREPEWGLNTIKATPTNKNFKIWLQAGFQLHNAAMPGCDRLPTQVWKVGICLYIWNRIVSHPSPPCTSVVLGK